MNCEKSPSGSASHSHQQFETQARGLDFRDLLGNQIHQRDCEQEHEELYRLLREFLSDGEADVIELLADGLDPISFASDSNLVSEFEAAGIVETALEKLNRCADQRLADMLCQRLRLASSIA